MENILILGSLPKSDEGRKLYEGIIDICNEFAVRVNSPIDTAGLTESAQERYQIIITRVLGANLIIGEQSNASTGQGIEIGYAALMKIPLIAIAKVGSEISRMVKGCPVTEGVIYYKDIADLQPKLRKSLQILNECRIKQEV